MAVLFRSAEWDSPWWARSNRGPGRYNRAGDPATQYLCSHPLTVFAERCRNLGRAFLAEMDTARWRCWSMRVDIADLDVVDFADAGRFGIDPAELVADDWAACQVLAQRCREQGRRGIVVPSAALPGTWNVVLFEVLVSAPWYGDPVDPVVEVPTAHTAECSIPPAQVLPLIRWHGDPHPALVAWRAGSAAFRFTDPMPSSPA